jgi:GTPase SAR1 family protein
VLLQVRLTGGRSISLGVWDTAGAEQFEAISRMYYHGSKAAVVCFDGAQLATWVKLQFWVRPTPRPRARTWLVRLVAIPGDGARSPAVALATRWSVVVPQMEELRQNEPQCRVYVAMTKVDRLQELPQSFLPQEEADADRGSGRDIGEAPHKSLWSGHLGVRLRVRLELEAYNTQLED